MGLWPARAARTVADAQASTPALMPRAVTLWPGFTVTGTYNALWAKQVPAFSRGLRVITGSVAQLPLVRYRNGAPVRSPWLSQLAADATNWETIQRTTEDLVLYGHAYWQVLAVDGNGYPTVIDVIDADDVSGDDDGRTITVDGKPLPVSNPATSRTRVGSVIVFEGYDDGVLLTGVETLTTALSLEAATRNYADTPMPSQVLKNTSTYELSETEITELLAAYTAARKASSVAYLNGGIDVDTLGFDAQQTALVDQKNQSRLAIANLLNLDPSWVGASVQGSALTYTNRVDLRTDLYGLTLTDYTLPIEQRLSMPDVSAPSEVVQFDATQFLRSNLEQRASMAVALVGAGVITTTEARDFVSPRPTGGIA